MLQRLIPLPLVLASLALAGCQSKPARSGFLGPPATYDSLVQSPHDDDVWVHRTPGRSLGEFDRIMIDPVRLHAVAGAKLLDEPASEVSELAAFFGDELRRTLGERYEIVHAAGPGVLRIRAALTELDPSKPALNILPTTALTGAGIGGATMEAAFRDGGTGDRIAIVMAHGTGKRYKYTKGWTTWGHAKDVLTYWAELLRERMDAEHEAR